MTHPRRDLILEMLRSGMSAKAIASAAGVAVTTVYVQVCRAGYRWPAPWKREKPGMSGRDRQRLRRQRMKLQGRA